MGCQATAQRTAALAKCGGDTPGNVVLREIRLDRARDVVRALPAIGPQRELETDEEVYVFAFANPYVTAQSSSESILRDVVCVIDLSARGPGWIYANIDIPDLVR